MDYNKKMKYSSGDVMRMMEAYKEHCTKAENLPISDVVGRSEQLVCVHPYSDIYQSDTECYCEKCGKDLTEAN